MFNFIIVGLIAGYLAGKISKGTGFGLIGNLLLGIGGSFVGQWLFEFINLASTGLLGSIAMSTVGALVVLFIAGKIKS